MSQSKDKLITAAMLGAMAHSLSPQVFDILAIPKGRTPNKYKPHQGKKEVARRMKQMQRSLGSCVCKDEAGKPLNKCSECPR